MKHMPTLLSYIETKNSIETRVQFYKTELSRTLMTYRIYIQWFPTDPHCIMGTRHRRAYSHSYLDSNQQLPQMKR